MTDPVLDPGGDQAQMGGDFADLATALANEDGAGLDPRRVLDFVARALPHTDHCGLTLADDGRPPLSVAASDGVPVLVERLQHDTGEGPFLDTAALDEVVRSDDLQVDTRWPVFASRCAAETGIRSVLSVRLPLAGVDRAALTLYSTQPAAFGDQDLGIVSILTPYAALAVQQELHQRDVENLQTALAHSRTIGTAVGIVMTRELVGADEAFGILRSASQDLHRKIRDIAREVAETGQVPGRRD